MKLPIILVFFVLLLQGCASTTTEINLTGSGSVDKASTAVIRVAYGDERKGHSVWNPVPPLGIVLASVQDLSKHEETTRLIADLIWTNNSGNHPRVSPGPYQVTVLCFMQGYNSVSRYEFAVNIDAKAGKLYLLECLRKGRQPYVDLREREQL